MAVVTLYSYRRGPSGLGRAWDNRSMLVAAASRMMGYDGRQKNCAAIGVTIGVTWGQQGFASESDSFRMMSGAQRMAALAELTDNKRDGLRGKFVETVSSPTRRQAPKSSKKMVGATGIEPVTPTMSR